MATRGPMPPPGPIGEHCVSRVTRGGKLLTYRLVVVQEPHRARACGAGAKSSADRRPVDPPPVVELRIFESDPHDEHNKTDITFAYNANFFLFATLESARPVAHPRVAPPPQSCPVLTGVPVAGVAYLDRPHQAGYFIFPDLSVRHEGHYHLNFHFYEETKDSKDMSEGAPAGQVPAPNPSTIPSKPAPPQSALDFRLAVLSHQFSVYSAKKFPGLTMSTSLSRVIAEQGCRVRIRRDVRMRRRGDKRSDDFNYEEQDAYRSSDRFPSSDAYARNAADRDRSASISTTDLSYPYGPDAQRRQSTAEYGYPAAQPYQRPMPPAPAPGVPGPTAAVAPVAAAPPPPQAAASHPSSHLAFGSTQSQYMAPQPPQSAPVTTPSATYSPHPPSSHHRTPSTGTEYDSMRAAPPSEPRQTTGDDREQFRLPPIHLAFPKPLDTVPANESRSSDPSTYRPTAPPASRPLAPPLHSLPPLRTLERSLPEFQPPSGFAQNQSAEMTPTKKTLWDTAPTLTKRTHAETFGHDDRPLYNGMRPDTESYPVGQRKASEDSTREAFHPSPRDEMEYKRANGRMASKPTPAML
ncbi:hypothetical protein P168DRAFT_314862 [Aspergillus campestris IBT 28561]|uniref:Developmental and secondary metabolism regulator veA n=1 Tax=Aspergillus campestris (strain IBT 28561) TaxID=1392248 RepID=A0A2I1DG07_ASPC2|nr:uncharacterized protein P168DRAFT_314862 [Aspergillus campestris IBT 28561]PKY08807.1 hypothetical protein P168DRAFT_314862 [Aspergillus campestris IBT 28561]